MAYSADDRLVDCLKNDLPQGLRELLRRYQSPLLAFVRSIVGDRQLAEDVLQEIVIKVTRKIGGYTPVSEKAFSSWLYRIARNEAINAAKKYGKIRQRETGNVEAVAGCFLPLSIGEWSEFQLAVTTALAALPETERTAVQLRIFENFSYQEISERMQAPLGTVGYWLHEAMTKLATSLRSYLDMLES